MPHIYFETFNGSSWGTIWERLQLLAANDAATRVLFAPEVKLIEGSIDVQSNRACNIGWQSFWAPPVEEAHSRASLNGAGDSGVSAGVAIPGRAGFPGVKNRDNSRR